jgi:hypothetical protein
VFEEQVSMENKAVSPALGLVCAKKPCARRPRQSSKSFTEETQKHFQILGIPVGASKARIKEAYRALVLANHPDRGGDAEALKNVVEAYRALQKALPKRGRPQKYVRCDGFAIVNELQANAVIADGFESRKEAKDALKNLRSLSVMEGPSNGGKPCRLAIVGSVASQKNKKYREQQKVGDAEKLTFKYWNKVLAKSGLSVSRGQFMEDAPHGCGLLVTGGYGSRKVEAVDAAQNRGLGGPDIPARRVRGVGNGPDAFDRPDETADASDVCDQESLSWGDYDCNVEREFQGMDEFFLPGKNDRLLGPSDEDRNLHSTAGWDDFRTGRPEKLGLYLGDGHALDAPDLDTSEPDESFLRVTESIEKCDENNDIPAVDAVNLLKE